MGIMAKGSGDVDLYGAASKWEYNDAKKKLADMAPDERDFVIKDRDALGDAYDQRRGQYGQQEQTALANALAARQGQQQAAGMLSARAAGRGPSVAALQGQQAVAQAGQAANAAAAGGRGAGGMALAQRLAMANGGMAAGDAAMQAAAGRNREVGQSQAALGQALAQMRQSDIGESSQSASAADAYINAAARVRQEQATLVAAQKRAAIAEQLRRMGVSMDANDALARLQQQQLETDRTNQGAVLSGVSGAVGGLTVYGEKNGWFKD